MASITLDIPDELLEDIASIKAELPSLLVYALTLRGTLPSQLGESDATSPLIVELLDFFMMRPTHQEIADFKFSENLQDRLAELLDVNREEELTLEQKAELDTFQQMNHLLTLLKARLYQSNSKQNGHH